jgi:hypothetical protein
MGGDAQNRDFIVNCKKYEWDVSREVSTADVATNQPMNSE